MASLGNLDVLCTCGRMLHIPVTLDGPHVSNGQVIARVEIDRAYLHAHAATWHGGSDGEPLPAHELLAAA